MHSIFRGSRINALAVLGIAQNNDPLILALLQEYDQETEYVQFCIKSGRVQLNNSQYSTKKYLAPQP